MTKAEQILKLLKKLPDTPERNRLIASKVRCMAEYVRVVKQRDGTSQRACDRRWHYKNREYRLAQMRAHYHKQKAMSA